MRRLSLALLLLLPVVSLPACSQQNTGQKPVAQPDSGTGVEEIPPSALVVANWNLTWFGSTNEAPTDDALQSANVAKVMKAIDADLWSMQEVVNSDSFEQLAKDVGEYEALPSNDVSVEGGPQVYANPGEQKLGIIYRTSRLEVISAKLVLRESATFFNGRAPMEVELETKPGKTKLTVLDIHLAAGFDAAAYEKRKSAAAAIKAYLDAKPAGSNVIIAGDFNDGLEGSTVTGQSTPFTALLDDPAYTFTTKGLKSPRYKYVIDHQLVTDDFAAFLVPSTPKVTDGDTLVTDYVDTTSDHDPTSVRYELP